MVRIGLLDTNEAYRVNPPAIAPDNDKNRKKGFIYTVLAPTIRAEMDWMRKSGNTVKFRGLYKYFVPKKYLMTLYGLGNRIIQPDDENQITSLFKAEGNLSNVDGITSYLMESIARPLRGLNVLAEVNFITEQVFENPKDKRLNSVKVREWVSQLQKYLPKVSVGPGNVLGDYTDQCMFIPMDLWFQTEEFRNPEPLFKRNNPNRMAQFLRHLTDPAILKTMPNVILVDDRVVLKLEAPGPDSKDPSGEIKDVLTRFIRKCFINRMRLKEPEEATVVEKLHAAEKASTEDDIVDQTLEKAKIDPNEVKAETREKVKQEIKKAAPKKKIVSEPVASAEPVPETLPQSIEEVDRISAEGADLIVKAKMEGRSVASQKRNEVLKEKYKTLKIGTVDLASVVESEEKYEIKPVESRAHTVNPMMKSNRAHELEKSYNENLAQYDLANILLHFSKIHPALYLNKDIKVSDASTPTDRLIRYELEFEDEDRKRHRVKFLMPKMYRDKYLYLNDMEMNISHQKFPYPVTKTAPDRVQLVTNYNKLFSERYGSAISPRISKIKKILTTGDGGPAISVEHGDGTILNKMDLTTVEYDDLASVVTKIQCGQPGGEILTIHLVVDYAKAAIPAGPARVKGTTTNEDGTVVEAMIDDDSLLPLGVKGKRGSGSTKTYYYISGRTNLVYDQKGTCYGELSDFMVKCLVAANPKLEETLGKSVSSSRYVYSRTKIMGEWIPTIIVAGAADPGGMIAVLEKAKINYQFSEKRVHVDIDTTGVIPFNDGYLIYDRYPYENSLLMNGLSTIPTREYSFYDLNSRDTYVDIMESITGRRTIIDGIQNFYYLMVDPITKDVLERLQMPTDFTTLLIYCVGTLADNTFQIDSNYANSRVRSNEIINAYLYKALATGWEAWRMGKADKFSVREDAVIKSLMEVQIVDPHSKLNVTLEAENDSLIKLKGPSGMNEDHSFTLEKRAYHPSMAGVVAMNSTPSGEVGIGRHLSMNANIDDARGFITIDKKEYDGTELASVGEMLQPFAVESSDIERVAMSISQAKHLVPVTHPTSNLIGYDMDRTVPYLSNDFAFRAKKSGKVIKIEEDIMVIQYDDGTYDDVDLSKKPEANVDGGFYVINQMEAQVKVGSRFKENQILAYDPKYINGNDMFGDPCADVGALARVAFMANGGVYEDSGFITDKFAHEMGTRITRQKRVILSKFANIKYMVKVGQTVGPNDPLLTFDDTEDEFSSQLLASIAEEQDDEDEILATSAPVYAKTAGVIADIMIYYTIDPSEMTPSMRKIVNAYVSQNEKRTKLLSKYRSPSDSNTILRPTEKLIPDGLGKVKGVEIGDGVMIDFYIEYLDIMSPGDKASATALKCTQSFIIPQEYAPYTDFNPERPVDMAIASIGMYKRMCLDIIKVGGLTKLLVEMKRIHRDKYLDRIKQARKKK